MITVPRVSVVMVTADPHAPYIQEAVYSVICQSFTQWELIIIDDGPVGAVMEMVAGYNDPRIQYFRQEHVGVHKLGATYNRALSLAKAPFIAILEGDDYWPSDKLEKQIPAIEQCDAVLSYGIVENVNADGKRLRDYVPAAVVQREPGALENSPRGRAAVAMARYWQYVAPASIVMRRSVLEDIGGFQQPAYYPAVDFPTVLKLATIGSFQFLPSVLGFYRQHKTSVTAHVFMGKIYLLGMFRCWLETMQSSDIEISRADADSIITHWKKGFSGHYLVLGRKFLEQRERGIARTHFLASLGGSIGIRSAVALVGTFLSYVPGGSYLLEGCFKLLGRPSGDTDKINELFQEAVEIIPAFEAWTSELKSLCYQNGNDRCRAGAL